MLAMMRVAVLSVTILLLTHQAQAVDFPELGLPDSMSVKVVADQMKMGSLNARVYEFSTQDTPDELEQYFSRQWGRVARVWVEPWDILTHRDGGFLITVQSRTDMGMQTHGIIAITDVFDAEEEGRAEPSTGFPMLSGTEVIQNLRSEDAGKKSQTVVLRSRRSVTENLDYYRNHFRRQGYQPVSYGAMSRGDDTGVMILDRGNETIDLVAKASEEGTVITIVKVQN